jgi:hypothetical protein
MSSFNLNAQDEADIKLRIDKLLDIAHKESSKFSKEVNLPACFWSQIASDILQREEIVGPILDKTYVPVPITSPSESYPQPQGRSFQTLLSILAR